MKVKYTPSLYRVTTHSYIYSYHFRHIGVHENDIVVGQCTCWLAMQHDVESLSAVEARVADLDAPLQEENLEQLAVGLGVIDDENVLDHSQLIQRTLAGIGGVTG